jgi:hypothetical protein
MRINIFFISIIVVFSFNTCVNSNKSNNENYLNDIFHYDFEEIFKYNNEHYSFHEDIILENISFPSFYCGVLASVVEISTRNVKNEKDKYYIFYLPYTDKIKEILIIGKKYKFYYEFDKVEFQVYAGNEKKNIEGIEVKWLRKYVEL